MFLYRAASFTCSASCTSTCRRFTSPSTSPVKMGRTPRKLIGRKRKGDITSTTPQRKKIVKAARVEAAKRIPHTGLLPLQVTVFQDVTKGFCVVLAPEKSRRKLQFLLSSRLQTLSKAIGARRRPASLRQCFRRDRSLGVNFDSLCDLVQTLMGDCTPGHKLHSLFVHGREYLLEHGEMALLTEQCIEAMHKAINIMSARMCMRSCEKKAAWLLQECAMITLLHDRYALDPSSAIEDEETDEEDEDQ